jgi:predicted metalloprotease
MKWQGRERSSNIEDRRGTSGGMGGLGRGSGLGSNPFGRGGGIGIPTGGRSGGGIGSIIVIIIVLGVIWLVTKQNPIDVLTGGGQTATTSSQSRPLPNAGQDQLADFVGVVVKETENFWGEVFQQNNRTYPAPSVVLFSGATQSGCGTAQSDSGPFYCPNDQKVYIDLSFYDQLRDQFGAAGDFEVDEAREEVVAVLRAGRGLGVVLDREDRLALDGEAGVRAVEQRDMGLGHAGGQASRFRPRSRGSSR